MAKLDRWQLALLHMAPKALGVDEHARRMVQRTLGGAESARDMGPRGFADCMAFWESRGWRDAGRARGFWSRYARRGSAVRMRGKVYRLAEELGWRVPGGRADFGRVDGFVERQTGGRRTKLAECNTQELAVVIEGLKAMFRRTGSSPCPQLPTLTA